MKLTVSVPVGADGGPEPPPQAATAVSARASPARPAFSRMGTPKVPPIQLSHDVSIQRPLVRRSREGRVEGTMRFVLRLLGARTTPAGTLRDGKRAGAGRGNETLRLCWARYCGSSRGCVRSSPCSPVD